MKILNTSTPRWLCGIAFFSGAVILGGCVKSSDTSTPPTTPSKSTSEDSSTIMKNGRPLFGSDKAEWIGEVAPKEITVKPKDVALVAIPINRNSFHFIVGRVDKVDGETATVTEILHPRDQTLDIMIDNIYSNIPGGLIFPFQKNPKLKEGDWAVGVIKERWLTLGRVTSLKGDRYSIHYYDDVPRDEDNTFVFPLSGEVAAMQPVIYKKKFGSQTLAQIGFVTLQIGDEFLVTSSAGSTVSINPKRDLMARADLAPLNIQAEPFQVGDTVQAYRGSRGFEEGKITKVIEPGFEYQTDLPDLRSPTSEIPHFWLQSKNPIDNSPE